MSDAGLENLAGLKQLTELDLAASSTYSRLGDAGIKQLAPLTRLKKLDLDYNPVSQTALGYLGLLTSLEELRLNGSDITDVSVPWLKSFARLHMLDLYHTLVTQRGFDDLKAALPGCSFVWEIDSSGYRRRKS